MGAALGDDDVGMVEEPIDRGCREAFREDRVEAGRMKVRGQYQRPLLRSGVDQAIQRLGVVGAGRQQAEAVDGQFSWPPPGSFVAGYG